MRPNHRIQLKEGALLQQHVVSLVSLITKPMAIPHLEVSYTIHGQASD